MPSFGQFRSFSRFLDAYEASQQQQAQLADAPLTLAARRTRRQQERNIVEVDATVHIHEPNDQDGDQHIRLRIKLMAVVNSNPNVDADLQRCLQNQEDVFVAIRIGDRMGILQPPTTGIDPPDRLHLRGEWITRDQAQQHGGELMSVLHFTHHPVGFICTETPLEMCYS